MNKNIAVIGIVVLLLVAAGVIYATQKIATPSIIVVNDNPITTPPTNQPRPAQRPVAVTNANAVPTDTTAVVTGTVTPNGAFTAYWYEYGLSPTGGQLASPNQIIGSGYAAIPAPGYLTGLVRDTTYYFRLVSENQAGRVTGSQYSFRTTQGNPIPVGSVPTTITQAVSGVTRSAATLNGRVTPNRAATWYWFEYGSSPNLGNTTALQSVGNGTTQLSASITLADLLPATTYYFRLNAQNQFGTVNGEILNFETVGPASTAKPNVETKGVTDITSTTATFLGTVNPNGLATSYWFEYSPNANFAAASLKTTEKKSLQAGSNNVSVEGASSGLSSQTTYYFRLVAQNSLGLVRGERLTFKTK